MTIAELRANYVVRITGPGVDHQVMVACAEDFEALELILAKVRRHFALMINSPQGECPTGDYERAGMEAARQSGESPALILDREGKSP